MADGYFIAAQDAPQVEMRQGVHRRTMGTTDEVMLCEFFLLRDAQVPAHSHPNDQVGYVVFGSMALTVGEQTRVVTQGESYAIPGGIVHSAHAEVDTLLVEAFSPPRDDFRRTPSSGE